MLQAKSILDVWWQLAGIFSGGVLGLFLLGYVSRRVTSGSAALAVAVGVLVVLWATFSQTDYWPDRLESFRNPFNSLLTIVIGTLVILITGLGSSCFARNVFGSKNRRGA
jgi:SSS family solute:Na+ symporter